MGTKNEKENNTMNNVIITKYQKSPHKKDKHLSPSQSTNTGDTSSVKEISQTDSERKVPKDVRIAVIGNVDSGKSTMIGVLTSGECDDGRGSARSRILRHNHEQANIYLASIKRRNPFISQWPSVPLPNKR